MKCVQLVESWFQGPFVTGLENKYQLHLKYGVDLLNSLHMKFSVATCEDEMETQIPETEETSHPPPSDMKWRGLPKLSPTQSPAWGHLKMELDLQAMMEEDSAPRCRRDLYLAFTQCAAQEACNIGERRSESSRLPCDVDSLYEESGELVSPSISKPEDRNLARLIAKFDSSIEALWNPDDVSEMVEDIRDEYGDDHLAASPVSMDMHGSKQNIFIACGTNITSSIWSSRPSPEEPLREEWTVPRNVKWSEGEGNPCFDSLVALNHNREDSSFTEVIPRAFYSNREVQPPAPAPQPTPSVPPDPSKEEEDLLTSARTHFIPIRQEPAPRQQQHQSTNYADGTTFAIPTSLDRIAYTRSESGALYIEDEANMDSPPKYMEYRAKECWLKSVKDHIEEVDFVPKFRVTQNEKCCQTEQEDTSMESSPLSDLRMLTTGEDFFFPGDEQLSIEVDGDEITESIPGNVCEKSSGPTWIQGWPSHQHERQMSPQSWYRIWSDGNGCWDVSQPPESHKSQLRQELSEDGEQLLSDLSSLLDQYGGVLSEINGNKSDRSEKMAEYTVNYKILKTGPLSNSGTAQKERKRRYSSSQRVCSLFLEGSCRRPHCRFSHDMASIPCHFWADASCLKGGKCPFLHGGRPVTL